MEGLRRHKGPARPGPPFARVQPCRLAAAAPSPLQAGGVCEGLNCALCACVECTLLVFLHTLDTTALWRRGATPTHALAPSQCTPLLTSLASGRQASSGAHVVPEQCASSPCAPARAGVVLICVMCILGLPFSPLVVSVPRYHLARSTHSRRPHCPRPVAIHTPCARAPWGRAPAAPARGRLAPAARSAMLCPLFSPLSNFKT